MHKTTATDSSVSRQVRRRTSPSGKTSREQNIPSTPQMRTTLQDNDQQQPGTDARYTTEPSSRNGATMNYQQRICSPNPWERANRANCQQKACARKILQTVSGLHCHWYCSPSPTAYGHGAAWLREEREFKQNIINF